MTNYDTADPEPPDPPEEPYLRSEPAILSPASPKPLHFPQPTNLPVLDKMMDVGFNQTEPHMNELRDTELRPGAWRDPEDQQKAPTDHASPCSTGGGADATADDQAAVKAEPMETEDGAHSDETATNGHHSESDPSSNGVSHEASLVKDESASVAQEVPLSLPSASVESTQPATAVSSQSNEMNPAHSQSTPFTGAVDVQSLLNTLQTSIAPVAQSASANDGDKSAAASFPFTPQAPPPNASADASPTPGLGSSLSGLPPRPPPQEQPLINANYVHSQHIRDYHPHAANPAMQSHGRSGSSGNAADPQSNQFVPPVGGTQQPPTPSGSTFTSQQSPVTAAFSDQHSIPTQSHSTAGISALEVAASGTTDSNDAVVGSEDRPWTSETQVKYDHFMNEERRYVNEAKWDQFPQGSRLFVGNLSSEKVTKRDIFHVFHPYGDIAQISIKQAYGFVQFLRTEDCMRAMAAEQGRQVRDKRIHLEVSKPQKPPRNQQQQHNQGRRSRSPAYDSRGRQGNDRHTNGRGGRGRDGDYRSNRRSPSPRAYRDRHQERYRTRSRSPGYGRDRYRGESPQRSPDDDLPLPRRRANDVPEVQIIALDLLDRDFLSWVEKAFSARGVRVDVLTISPRLSEEAVVRRQIVEGVLAICKLRRINQDTGKVGLTIFKRSGGAKDVQFEEYDNLDPDVCAQLAIRERQNAAQPPMYSGYSGSYSAPLHPPQQQYSYQQPLSQYGAPPPGYPPNYGQAPAPYASHPGYPPQAPSVDPNNLQNLLSSLNTSTPQAPGRDTYGTPAQQGFPPQPQSYQTQQYQPGPTGSAPPPAHQQQRPPAGLRPMQPPPNINMQDILARLGSYNRQ